MELLILIVERSKVNKMTDNIKEALQYSVELAGREEKVITDVNGQEWYDKRKFDLEELKERKYYPERLHLRTLSSLVEYVLSGLNGLLDRKLIVVVDNPKEVYVYTEDDERARRTTLGICEAIVPDFSFDRYYDMESFNIALQSRFVDVDDRSLVIDYASKISIENGADIEDDGVSQVTTIKNGVASKGKAKAPNPVTLAPYRTFSEVEQPSSKFVFRINKEGHLALFEADGGAWRLDAVNNVADFLKEHFADYDNITVLA